MATDELVEVTVRTLDHATYAIQLSRHAPVSRLRQIIFVRRLSVCPVLPHLPVLAELKTSAVRSPRCAARRRGLTALLPDLQHIKCFPASPSNCHQERAGVPVERQRLLYKGKILRNTRPALGGPGPGPANSLSDFSVESGHTIRLVARTPANSPYNSPQGPHTLQADGETMRALALQHQRLVDSLASAAGEERSRSPELLPAEHRTPAMQRRRGTSLGSATTRQAALASAARRRAEQRRVEALHRVDVARDTAAGAGAARLRATSLGSVPAAAGGAAASMR